MFDFANSAYTTVIITVLYGVVYSEIIVGPDAAGGFRRGNLYWSIALAAGYGLVVLTAPLLGAMMDYSAARKKFLFASYLFTVTTTAMMYFIGPQAYMAGMLLIILSNFGFSVGESFVSSFLPYLGPPEELGKISGYAWGLGYFGGLASMLLVARLGPVQADNYVNLRFVGPVTA
ncbi:MAG: MFS transporter, partial [Acidobacteria bacterium]|nr:MFS transporter [Acidobacteriota bacterium]